MLKNDHSEEGRLDLLFENRHIADETRIVVLKSDGHEEETQKEFLDHNSVEVHNLREETL